MIHTFGKLMTLIAEAQLKPVARLQSRKYPRCSPCGRQDKDVEQIFYEDGEFI